MKIGTITTEVPEAGGRRPTMPEVIEIMEKAKMLAPDQWLIIEADDKREALRIANGLKTHKHHAKIRKGLTVYVSRNGSASQEASTPE